MQPAEFLHERLRRLAVEDPREARKAFLQVFDSGGSALEQFLGQISSPADGRLRHVVASALRNNRDKERLAPYLIAWHEIETDEFAKRVIAAALDGVRTESAGQTALAQEVARLTTAIGRETAQRERLNRELEIAREVPRRVLKAWSKDGSVRHVDLSLTPLRSSDGRITHWVLAFSDRSELERLRAELDSLRTLAAAA